MKPTIEEVIRSQQTINQILWDAITKVCKVEDFKKIRDLPIKLDEQSKIFDAFLAKEQERLTEQECENFRFMGLNPTELQAIIMEHKAYKFSIPTKALQLEQDLELAKEGLRLANEFAAYRDETKQYRELFIKFRDICKKLGVE